MATVEGESGFEMDSITSVAEKLWQADPSNGFAVVEDNVRELDRLATAEFKDAFRAGYEWAPISGASGRRFANGEIITGYITDESCQGLAYVSATWQVSDSRWQLIVSFYDQSDYHRLDSISIRKDETLVRFTTDTSNLVYLSSETLPTIITREQDQPSTVVA